MNSYQPVNKLPRSKPRTPIYASPWVALYLVLRDEVMQPRPTGK